MIEKISPCRYFGDTHRENTDVNDPRLLQSDKGWPEVRRRAHRLLDTRLDHIETLYELVQRTQGVYRLWHRWRLERLLDDIT